ncbi:MAG TPA: TetR/AcrR family transcriptional regulator [Blastocatellia bacterium]|jgi:TetR/AcrR family transcriptional regulator|nr:TetR/AcrR family transcriptional regulator [Blastocatellia bacterium]
MARSKAEDPEARAKILTAAEELFAARGFAGTAIRQIAANAGVNGAMVHYYFGNKEGLYRAILERAAGGVRALLEQAAGAAGPIEERLAQFIEAYFDYIFGHPNFVRILNRELMAGGAHLLEIIGPLPVANYEILRDIMARGVRRGDFRALDVDLAPISLIGMALVFHFLQPVIHLAFGGHEYDKPFLKRISAHTVDLFLNGAKARIKAPPGEAGKGQGKNRRTAAKRRARVKR